MKYNFAETSKAGNTVNSVSKAIRILNCFTHSQPELTLSQISRLLNIPKSTALNIVKTLEQEGYLLKEPSGILYRLGFKLLEHSYCIRSTMPVVQYSLPFIEELQVRTSEAIYLTTHINGRVLYLEGVYPTRRVVNYSISGKTLPMHCTGCGKAMLAYLPEGEVDEIIERLGIPAINSNTISDPIQLKKELEEIRKRGYAIDIEEESMGVKCIGMAVRNASGYPVGAVSIAGTVISMKDELLDDYAALLSKTCLSLADIANQFPAGKNRIV